jgi:KUP system potassium uptake protein
MLLALILQQKRRNDDSRRRALLVILGLFGAAPLYGDGIITPAISVLQRHGGLERRDHDLRERDRGLFA